MAASLVQQLYSQNHWSGIDGVQTVWNFTFSGGYIFKSHVKAYYVNSAGNRVNVDVTEGMFTGEFQLSVTPAIPASASRFVIYRDTPKDLPLVDFADGAVQTEANLDRIARQAVFIAAEAIDAVTALGFTLDTTEFGYKAIKRNQYVGASAVDAADNGKSHYKTDGTAVTVPNTLPVEFLSTIVNFSATSMTVTFTGGSARQQGAADITAKTTWTLSPWNTLSIWKAADGAWLISGKATGP